MRAELRPRRLATSPDRQQALMRPSIERKLAHHRRTKRRLNRCAGCHRIQTGRPSFPDAARRSGFAGAGFLSPGSPLLERRERIEPCALSPLEEQEHQDACDDAVPERRTKTVDIKEALGIGN